MYTKPCLTPRATPGFTIIELIVAMGLSVLIATLCTIIFNQTSAAVRTGAATSDMMGNLRTINDQMQSDARHMIGPIRPIGPNGTVTQGGYLVIIQEDLVGMAINTPQFTETTGTIANDQVAFICTRGDSEPMCPGNNSSFSNTSYAAYKRVWYGHVLRTKPDGTDAGGFGTDPNRLANWFILGRQALFLDGSGVASPIHANGVDPNAPVVGWGADAPGIAKQLYMGLTDISSMSLTDLNNKTAPPFDAIDLTFFANRLRVNPAPNGNTFASWQIAQNHAAFVNNVSDFEVTYQMPGDVPGTWHRTAGGPPLKWGPGDAGSWPTLIRFRWRMHDYQARIGQGPSSGRWYEQIIRVKGD